MLIYLCIVAFTFHYISYIYFLYARGPNLQNWCEAWYPEFMAPLNLPQLFVDVPQGQGHGHHITRAKLMSSQD